jgi:TatA/E family protein of Tat protein translocase
MGKIEGMLILGAIIMLLFGAKQLPKLARSVGESVQELKKGFDPNALSAPSQTTDLAKTQKPADGTRADG